MQDLNSLDFPLHGSHLIEASAGTGKTFTIAMLYLRLVLGHGGEAAFAEGRRLNPPEILVVTFTEAATQELRERIRARLTQAADYFRAAINTVPENDPLVDLRKRYAPSEWPDCARRLALAAEWMDEAAVSTIHGWCYRMLQQHAFASQSLFRQHLEADQTELLAEVVRDYWRIFLTPLPAHPLREVIHRWPDPAAFGKAVGPLLKLTDDLPRASEPAAALTEWAVRRADSLRQIKAPWAAWADELCALLNAARAEKRFNGTKLKPVHYEKWLAQLRDWANDPTQDTLPLTQSAVDRLSPAGLADAWTQGEPPTHPALLALADVPASLKRLPTPDAELLTHAADWIARRFAEARQQRAEFAFDDLLTRLDAALAGPRGTHLAELIRRQFPVALIDEFQDTDPVQYRIFDRIYQLAEDHGDRSLILIGDPKQAIYAFRGADIHSYLAARQAVGRHRRHTLGVNYRSTPAMVTAVNHCFDTGEKRPAGAFLFAGAEDNPLPFTPVGAREKALAFTVDGRPPAALQLTLLTPDEALSKTRYIEQMAESCASQIVDWLNRGLNGQAGFSAPGESGLTATLAASDIAVLVNDGIEARAIRQALNRRGVRSVYLSDRDSVYASPQALEVQRWLQACADPGDERLIRAALATPSFGLDWPALDALARDEQRWEACVLRFKGYQGIWQQRGVLPLLRQILFDFAGTQRLLEAPIDAFGQSGERRLTDFLHLAELLQAASVALDGEHALLRHLAEAISNPKRDADSLRLRLESDADLVRVITIHKSKGLEYPLVFLPFLCAARPLDAKTSPLIWHDAAGKRQVVLSSSAETLAYAERERLAEDLRKLYVALTRARYLTWVGIAPLEAGQKSALAYLFGLDELPVNAIADAVQALGHDEASIAVSCLPEPETVAFRGRQTATTTGVACRMPHPAREAWWISSYSALAVEEHSAPLLDDSPKSANLIEALQETSQAELASGDTMTSLASSTAAHGFARGAEAGTFLHEVLEWAARQGFSTVRDDPTLLSAYLASHGNIPGGESWQTALIEWFDALLRTPLTLASSSVALADLGSVRPEMEFWFAAHAVDLQQLDALVCAQTLDGRPRPRLREKLLNGMLKGFIDLIFEHEGRYYVADYKSNWLGPDDRAYTADAMQQAIAGHRYDLQFAIYLLALHRLLRSRLADYDYDRHIGGAAYLFLRGISAESAGVHFERPPRQLIEQLDAWFSGTSCEEPGE